MRLLHTADWHLGRALEGRSRAKEQEEFADEICAVAADENIDFVVIAGDVFDNGNPPAQAEDLFYDTIDRLCDGGNRAVLVLAGNHDSPERLCAARPLANRHGIALVGRPNDLVESKASTKSRVTFGPLEPGVARLSVPGLSHDAIVIALPYPSEARLREVLDQGERTEEDLQRAYVSRLMTLFGKYSQRLSPESVSVMASHLFVMGGKDSESERPLTVGGAYTVPPKALDYGTQYVALGHLHRPQTLSSEGDTRLSTVLRYAGSPLSYSFSEAGQAKSVTVVDLEPGKPAFAREVLLNSGQPLVKWSAPEGITQVEAWCRDGKDKNAWIDLEIHLSQALTFEEIGRLRKMNPGFIHIRPIYPEMQLIQREARASLPLPELFRQFYLRRRNGEPSPALVRLFVELSGGEQTGAEDGDHGPRGGASQ